MGLEKDAGKNRKNVLKLKINSEQPEQITTADDNVQHHIDHDHDQHMMMNKHADQQVQDQDHHQVLPYVCSVCNERLKSGQALGGHMRIHRNTNKNNKTVNTVMKPHNKRKRVDIDHDEGEKIKTSSTATQEDHIINMIDDDFSNATHERRRRLRSSYNSPKAPPRDHLDSAKSGQSNSCSSSSTASKSIDIPVVDDSVNEAAITLMLLAHHNHHISLNSTLSDRINKNKEGEEEKQGKLTSSRISREKSGGDQYICGDCKISFPSYEALGVHTSTHNKKNNNITNLSTSFVDLSQSSDATDNKDGDDGDSKIVFYFDLNELPPSEDSSSSSSSSSSSDGGCLYLFRS